MQETGPIEPRELALQLADLIDERQGDEIKILDVSGPLAIADYFVIATVKNHRHATSLARELIPAAKSAGASRRHAAGLDSESGWVLLDFGLVVVHLLDEERRAFYALEILWNDVPRVDFTPRERPPSEVAGGPQRPDTFPTGWPDPDEDF